MWHRVFWAFHVFLTAFMVGLAAWKPNPFIIGVATIHVLINIESAVRMHTENKDNNDGE